MNPRLDLDWLEYLVPIGATQHADGWRWNIDPSMRFGSPGPWRPEWAMEHLPGIGVPVLGILGLETELMGWGTRPEDVLTNLPALGRYEGLEGVGHFVHIEAPDRIADIVLDFLGDPPTHGGGRSSAPPVAPGWHGAAEPSTSAATATSPSSTSPSLGVQVLTHGRNRLALHQLATGTDPAVRPLLFLHGLGERIDGVPPQAASWRGPVYGLDFTGHGQSSLPTGGGYTAEVLVGDVDAALAELGPVTLLGRGLGGWVAMLTAGARPSLVRGAVLIDGHDTRFLSSPWLHAHLGIVPQQNHLFAGSIYENIRIVKPGAYT
jgi:pimeloyl-ACP methyl ester carboxylesterase